MKTPLIVDIETDGRPAQEGKLLLVGWQLADELEAHVADGQDTVWYGDAETLHDFMQDPEQPIVSMTKFDPRYLRLQGWDICGPYFDLQVMAWVLNENQMLSLDALARRYLGLQMDKRIKRKDGAPWFTCDCGKAFPMVDLAVDMPGAECHFAAFSEYCRRDVEAETRLFNTLRQTLESTGWWDYFETEEVPFTSVLLDMEVSGLPVNLDDSEKLREKLQRQHTLDAANLMETGGLPEGFNLNSGDQLASYLYFPVMELTATLDLGQYAVECLKACLDGDHEDCYLDGPAGTEYLPDGTWVGHDGIHIVDLLPERFTIDKVGRTSVHGRYTLKGRQLPPTVKTDSGKRWSTSSPVLRSNLKAMSDPWVQDLVAYRKVEKVLTTYLRRFPELAQDGRLYGRFNQTGTKTGRLSSSEPNLQNIPARGELGESVRSLFQGDLVVGDYSQLEPRLLAHYSQDPVLLEVYREGRDIYNVTGSAIFGMDVQEGMDERDISKVVFLGDQYGMGDQKLAATLTMNGFPTQPDVAKAYQNELHALYNIAEAWKDGVRRSVRAKGYVVTIGGRHRRLKAAFADRRNWKNIGYGERQAVNAIIQGSAGDVVRRVMVKLGGHPLLRLLAQVHDELVWECLTDDHLAIDLEALRGHAERGHGFNLSVPLVFEPHFGHSWFSAKKGIELPEDLTEETEGFDEDF